MLTPSHMRRRPATVANAPRGAATKAIAGPAPLHVAASTSLAMLRIVPSPRIAPCDENWNRMHRPMETSVLGVCERSDIVAVTLFTDRSHDCCLFLTRCKRDGWITATKVSPQLGGAGGAGGYMHIGGFGSAVSNFSFN